MSRKDVALFLVFGLLVVLGACLYIGAERTVYFWDEANFDSLMRESYGNLFPKDGADHFQPGAALFRLYDSFRREYNLLFTLPLLPVLRAFGTSRMAYVASLTLFYFVPLCAVVGLIATRIFHGPPRRIFWLTVALCVAMPLGWMTVMHGYPDVGAAAILGAAVLIHIGDLDLRSPRRTVALGVLLALAPLFRRHFVYGVLAFCAALFLSQTIRLIGVAREDRSLLGRELFRRTGSGLLLGVSLLGTLVVLAKPFVGMLITSESFSLYHSFMLEPLDVFRGHLSAYGVLVTGGAVAGYVAAFRLELARVPEMRFVVLFALASVFLWVFVSRQQGIHYTNHFNGFVILGLTGLAISAGRLERGKRTPALALISGVLVYRLLVGFAVVAPVDSLDADGDAMAKNPPAVRPDYTEIKRVIATLRDLASPPVPVYIVASSRNMNEAIIEEGEKSLYGEAQTRLIVPPHPTVDSRDWYPVELSSRAGYVLVVLPGQYAIAPPEQKVVTRTLELFERGKGLARDFTPLDGEFRFQGNCVGRLYRRVRTTPLADVLAELDDEIALLPARPGLQKKWISPAGDRGFEIRSDGPPAKAKSYNLLLTPGPTVPWKTPGETGGRLFLFLDDVPAGAHVRGTVTFEQVPNSQELTLQVVWLEKGTGRVLAEGAPDKITGNRDFDLPVPAVSGNAWLVLRVVPTERPPLPVKGRLALLGVTVGL